MAGSACFLAVDLSASRDKSPLAARSLAFPLQARLPPCCHLATLLDVVEEHILPRPASDNGFAYRQEDARMLHSRCGAKQTEERTKRWCGSDLLLMR